MRDGEQRAPAGWFAVAAPLWPIGLARILSGVLLGVRRWRQSKWEVFLG